ncbi:MAG: hypothetical protein FJW40_10275 [Acidobacteria bacterium]|nr:hypothetical protein [Acidobacteriota bacterium]
MAVLALLAAGASAADRLPFGLTASRAVLEASLAGRGPSRLLLLGGLDGSPGATQRVRDEIIAVERSRKLAGRFAVTAVAAANPGNAALAFPPTGDAYRDQPESHALWRFILAEAPDAVVIVGPDAGLGEALKSLAIPVERAPEKGAILTRLKPPVRSQARIALEARAARTPRQVADQLAKVYGYELNEVAYIPAFALIARARLGAVAEIEKIVEPYRSGSRDSLAKATSSHFSGHLVFADLARRTRNPRYIELVRAAANMGFDADGKPRESMPMHNRMSDSVFMGSPILAAAGVLTGERKYLDMAGVHYRFMRALDLRPDGIWRHSPLDEAAWGRGNAFALLGQVLTLSWLPASHPDFDPILRDFQNLAAALAKHQDASGMWRQVIDHPGAYREFTATSMIARSLLIGIRKGWLDAKSYQPRVDRAWRAINERISPEGEFTDVCESTGAQKSLEDYLRRKAVFGRDPRGGAMALLFATEMAGLD